MKKSELEKMANDACDQAQSRGESAIRPDYTGGYKAGFEAALEYVKGTICSKFSTPYPVAYNTVAESYLIAVCTIEED